MAKPLVAKLLEQEIEFLDRQIRDAPLKALMEQRALALHQLNVIMSRTNDG